MQTQISPEMEALKSRMRAVWMAGDFGVIARSVGNAAIDFVGRLPITAGMDVLDVACGTGNTAIPEAKAGANVTGIDLASNLIEQAIARAAAEGVKAKFEVGDAEDMPYPDASFDIVATMFGAMFAPRPEVTASELKRVCRPGGLIAMANWTPEAFTGMMFRTGAKHVPPPQGLPSPLMWGSEDVVRETIFRGHLGPETRTAKDLVRVRHAAGRCGRTFSQVLRPDAKSIRVARRSRPGGSSRRSYGIVDRAQPGDRRHDSGRIGVSGSARDAGIEGDSKW